MTVFGVRRQSTIKRLRPFDSVCSSSMDELFTEPYVYYVRQLS